MVMRNCCGTAVVGFIATWLPCPPAWRGRRAADEGASGGLRNSMRVACRHARGPSPPAPLPAVGRGVPGLRRLSAALWLMLGVVSSAAAGQSASLQFAEAQQSLHGRDARLQLLVSRAGPNGQIVDVTHTVSYAAEPAGVVNFSNEGLVTPLANGEVTVTARDKSGATTTTTIQVTDMGNEAPLHFAGRVVPIFTKLGCNGGGCHGKAAGQNGFKLSLLGFEPREDYQHLVHESRGRRLTPAMPDQSLLLLKAINASPHGGGQRMDADSYEYRILRRWIAQGMPYGSDDAPVVESIEVVPDQRRLPAGSTQQLAVIARLSDGSTEDVTRAAVFESNDPEMAEVSATGHVQLGELVGDVAVMARYQGKVTVFRAIVPHRMQPQPIAIEPRNVVDTFVFQKLQSLGIPPSPTCDDATFLRRVTLDIAGRLPTLAEQDGFFATAESSRRDELVERLLASADYADNFAHKWNTILRNRQAGGATAYANIAFHRWIRDSLDANKPYDQFAREIVAASGSVASHPPVAWYQQVTNTNQRLEDAAQLFLGQRLQCANCHHHPFEKWSQSDYAQMAAFFSTVTKKPGTDPGEAVFVTRVADATARHPKTGQSLPPAGLEADAPSVSPREDVRTEFASWMTGPGNPFFARSLVNRYWKHFMGRGLVEPEDDMRVTNPPTNPELLDAVSAWFIDSGYNLKGLVRLIVQSRTYQFDSDALEENLPDRRSYSRYYPKRLQAEVLLDAIDHVTGSSTSFDGVPTGTRAVALPNAGHSNYFLKTFGRSRSTTACECERTEEPNLAQNLLLLNSEEIHSKLAADHGRAAVLAADESRSDEQKIDQLYRLALARSPDDRELKITLSYLASKKDRRQAYEDLIWSLINSKEFLFNH